MRWIGCAAVWEAGRAVCGERHLRQTQAYSPTATEDDGVGRGDIHTYAIDCSINTGTLSKTLELSSYSLCAQLNFVSFRLHIIIAAFGRVLTEECWDDFFF